MLIEDKITPRIAFLLCLLFCLIPIIPNTILDIADIAVTIIVIMNKTRKPSLIVGILPRQVQIKQINVNILRGYVAMPNTNDKTQSKDDLTFILNSFAVINTPNFIWLAILYMLEDEKSSIIKQILAMQQNISLEIMITKK